MNSKVGMFSVLVFGIMILLIPVTSIANADENDKYFKEKKDIYSNNYRYDNIKDRQSDDYKQTSYDKQYKKVDKKESDRPVIIVDNKIPIPHQEKKEEKMKESPIVLVKKEVLFCDEIANGRGSCPPLGPWPGPNSDRYVQECNADLCKEIDESSFEIKVENENIFEGNEDGTKKNFNGERYTVTEETNNAIEKGLGSIVPEIILSFELDCKESGFDSSYIFGVLLEGSSIGDGFRPVISCVLFEGDCSGIVQDDQLKECTVKNYIVKMGLLL